MTMLKSQNVAKISETLLIVVMAGCALLFHGYPVDWLTPVVFVLVGMSVWRISKAREYPLSILHLVLCVTLVLLFFSSYWSGNPQASNLTFWRLSGIIWLFFLLSHRTSYEDTVPFAVILSALCAAVIGMMEYLQTFTRVNSIFLDANVLSAVMYTAGFVWLFHWVHAGERYGGIGKVFFWSGQFLLLVILFAAASRGGILVWVLGAVGVCLLNRVTVAEQNKLLMQYLLAIILALVFYMAMPTIIGVENFSRNYGDLHTLNGRLPIWQASWALIQQAPWIGNGLGTFHDLYPSIRTEFLTAGHHAHNDYVELMVEGGILLLGLFLLWVIFHFWLLAKILLRGARAGTPGFALGILLICNLMLFLHATVNFIVYVLWLNVVMGAVFAVICRIAWSEGYLNAPKWYPVSKVSGWCINLVVILAGMHFTLYFASSYIYDDARERTQLADALAHNLQVSAVILSISPSNPQATIALMNRLKNAMETTKDSQIKDKIFRKMWVLALMLREDTPFLARNHLIVAQLIDFAEENAIPLPSNAETFDQAWNRAVTLNPGYLQAHIVKAQRIEREDAAAAVRLLQGFGQGWLQFAPDKQVHHYLKALQSLLSRHPLDS